MENLMIYTARLKSKTPINIDIIICTCNDSLTAVITIQGIDLKHAQPRLM